MLAASGLSGCAVITHWQQGRVMLTGCCLGCIGPQLLGTIPPEFGDMPRLRVLRLEYNSMSGTIPESFR
jgi:hypothetical protein